MLSVINFMCAAVTSNLSDVEFSNVRLACNIPIKVSVFKNFTLVEFYRCCLSSTSCVLL